MGHIMRCMALADRFRAHGYGVRFLCRDLPGAPHQLIEQARFPLHRLPEAGDWEGDANHCLTLLAALPADILVVDVYALDARWESMILPQVKCLAVIDDLANREHVCDVLIDQNLHREPPKRYQNLVAESTMLLLGPSFALLREEFANARATLAPRTGSVQRIVVFYTGGDDQGETLKALKALAAWRDDIEVDAVVGAMHPQQDRVAAFCAQHGWRFHCQIDYMARLLAAADLAVGAGGSSSWERCALGVPALVCILADNQSELTDMLVAYGAVRSLGWASRLSSEDYRVALESLDAATLARMSQQAWALVDGMGAARVCAALLERAKASA